MGAKIVLRKKNQKFQYSGVNDDDETIIKRNIKETLINENEKQNKKDRAKHSFEIFRVKKKTERKNIKTPTTTSFFFSKDLSGFFFLIVTGMLYESFEINFILF